MPERPAVRREEVGTVVVLTLDNPAAGNVLDAGMVDALVTETSAIAREDEVRALVLTGAGAYFSLGGPVDEFAQVLDEGAEAVREYCRVRTEALATLVLNLHTLACPVIAAVNGQAAGAGFSLALACDLRIAAERAKFNFAYGALGASTDGGMSWLLPRVLNPARAVQLLLEQPVIRAARARDEGLVSEVVPAADLRRRAVEIAAGAGAGARHSVTAAKRLVHAAARTTLPEHLREEHRTFAEGLLTADFRAALAARRRGALPAFGGGRAPVRPETEEKGTHMSGDVVTATEKDAAIAGEMLAASRRQDWERVAELLDPEVVWNMPGNSRISGVAVGRQAVIERAKVIDAAKLTVEPQHVHIGYRSIVVTIHNTAEKPVPLEEWLALVFEFRDGLITTIDTHLSDIPMFERFYAA